MSGSAVFLPVLLAGVLLLVAGRRLFWLFVGLVGFLAGWRAAPVLFAGAGDSKQLMLALLCGLVGLVLAVLLQRLAVALAGFLVGGMLATQLLGYELPRSGLTGILIFVVAGLVMAALALWLFSAVLIVLSSLVGAGLIADAGGLGPGTRPIALVLLALVGIAIQAGITARGRARPRPAS